MARILIFTGKGGVGKTSMAAAHARQSAKEGKKTLLVSTDMAHNLGDLFECAVGREEKEVCENLYALEIDPNYVMEHDFSDVKNALEGMLSSGGSTGSMEDFFFIPGMEELFSLLKIKEIYEQESYERIIVDCAPTGETLSLLKFPEMLSWYFEKFFPVGKLAVRVVSPFAKAIYKLKLPDKKAMTEIERLYVCLLELSDLLKNREVSSIRLVAIPEKMVVEETKRNYMYMNLYDFAVDGLFINRILPKDIENPFFEEWISLQTGYIEELKAVFGTIPVYEIPWFDTDLNGISGIDRIVDAALSGRDLFAVCEGLSGERYEELENGWRLILPLPCAEKGELQMHETEGSVILRIGNFKRDIPKPDSLRGYEIVSAKLRDSELLIDFAQ